MQDAPGNNVRHIAGAMSGTSADGVDIAITRISGRGLEMTAELVKHHHRAYSSELRREIFAFRAGEVREDVLGRLTRMGREISLTYATAVNEALAAAGMQSSDLAAVAAHGQTLFHDPPGTIQWFDPSRVAAEVGCAVVSDFRRADLAAGGQGAPLVPFADYLLFRHPTKNRVLLNIGGIANITLLRAGEPIDQLVAFDTGPGNCLSDWLCRMFDPQGPGFDPSGKLAERGEPLEYEIRKAFYDDPFFERKAPKSTDTTQMIYAFEKMLPENWRTLPLEDLLATAEEVTCQTILAGLFHFGIAAANKWDEIIVSGGGTRNKAIMRGLVNGGRGHVLLSDELGVVSDSKEALAFALLGAATLDGVPSNVPSVTGARRAVVLGSVTPRP